MNVNKIISTTKETNIQIDGITLLSVDEYKKAKDYIKPSHFVWWLRSPGDYKDSVALVDSDGDVDYFGHYINVNFGVRPALRINLKSSDFQIGDSFKLKRYTWTIVSKDYALCDTTIGNMPFRKDWQAKDTNDYEKSDIKEFLEDWYNKQIKSYSDAAAIIELKPVCEDAISRADFVEHISQIIKSGLSKPAMLSRIMQYIKNFSSVEPKQPQGEWIEAIMTLYDAKAYKCSICHEVFDEIHPGRYHYCPNCGADMRGDKDV